MTSHPSANRPIRHKMPGHLAIIDPDVCTNCGACVEVCPADAIVQITCNAETPRLRSWCEVDWDRCVGCGFCVSFPKRKSEVHTLAVCPWGAIQMVPIERLVETVRNMPGWSGPLEPVRQQLLAVARRQCSPT